MARIAIGGWQHETNTFAPIKADFAAFERADEWPGLCLGSELWAEVEGVHLPVTGAIEALRERGHELMPLLWCAATPSAHVTEDAFERIAATLLAALRRALPLDGVFLDLHGAMVCEHLEDGDGEILRRVRAAVGPAVPVVASLDLHANVTPAMVAHADALDIYRTYPHVDMGETGARAAAHLHALLRSRGRWYKALRRTEFLIPLNWGCTWHQPARGLYARLPELVAGEVAALGFACGFPLSDIREAGPAVVAYAGSQTAADGAADALLAEAAACEADFRGDLYAPGEAVSTALRLAQNARGPIVLADTQDNPGGGGPGDTTGLLRALIEGGARGAVMGVLADPEAAARAHAAGVGAEPHMALGDKSGLPGHRPLTATFKVLGLGDGSFTATGPMYRGARMRLGPMALLEVEGVRVLVASKAVQAADQSMFHHLGVEAAREPIVALKSSVHFRNDFQEMASAILIVTAPGPVHADPGMLPFRHLRPEVRRRPRGHAGP